jgi:hypothetical protein
VRGRNEKATEPGGREQTHSRSEQANVGPKTGRLDSLDVDWSGTEKERDNMLDTIKGKDNMMLPPKDEVNRWPMLIITDRLSCGRNRWGTSLECPLDTLPEGRQSLGYLLGVLPPHGRRAPVDFEEYAAVAEAVDEAGRLGGEPFARHRGKEETSGGFGGEEEAGGVQDTGSAFEEEGGPSLRLRADAVVCIEDCLAVGPGAVEVRLEGPALQG